MSEDKECVCRGNWRAIVKDHQDLIGRRYRDKDENLLWTFFGVVHGDDDYYYGMSRHGQMRLLSCVGSIQGWGFTLEDFTLPKSGDKP